jgi:pimeloyl-ACP methyl ester carboxylesterase
MIDIPTMVIRGEYDGLISEDYAKAYAALIPGASFVQIAEAGHAPDVEQAEVFANTLSNWMES